MKNHLQFETSPYLRQHAENPVDWYPWGPEAFERARREDRPIFLSIGYSTCHWCHVMAHESFEDEETASLLNRYFVPIKVDKEQRPDIDSIYMAACQAFTGSGGWPMTVFMTPDQKPFFAGTYFPKTARNGMMGLDDLLKAIHRKWETDRKELLEQGEKVVGILSKPQKARHAPQEDLPDRAVRQFERTYDRKWGGFGSAPKFPAPHNLIFLMEEYRHFGKTGRLEMARHTIMSMYRGGLFDHIGFGFSRYSTDNRFLVPHFEKMLYDNALMILCCVKAHTLTQGDTLLLEIARRTARYILREMTSPDGGFYSAQDADSEGEEGKYYLFTPEEIETVLGSDDAQAFNRAFGITGRGNFEGKNIPSLLSSDPDDSAFDGMREKVYRYRRERHALHLDDKILTSWNGLMIAALCALYRVTGDRQYIAAAEKANGYVMTRLCEGDTLYTGSAADIRGVKGFLDDYAAMCLAQLALYGATYAQEYLDAAQRLFGKAVTDFADPDFGGFWFYSRDSEKLILRPKETYDGAMPSGNSLMAWNLVRLEQLTGNEAYGVEARRQLDFLKREASDYPAGYTAFLSALLEHEDPSVKITAVIGNEGDVEQLPFRAPLEAAVTVLRRPTKQFPLKDGKTTYYICSRFRCLAAANDLTALSEPAMPV